MATHMAICTACNTNTPTLRRSKPGLRSTQLKPRRPGSFCSEGSAGTHQRMTATPPRASTAVRPNKPGKPAQAASTGANTRDTANINPILPPTSAMALVRTTSRVWSASKAVTAADTAPAPCKARPSIKPFRSVAKAAHTLPAENNTKPSMITRLRPQRSDATPKGICRTPCVSP